MNAVNKAPMVATETEAEAQVTQEARPPGNRSEESTSTGTAKKIFVCSPYRPMSETEESRKTENSLPYPLHPWFHAVSAASVFHHIPE